MDFLKRYQAALLCVLALGIPFFLLRTTTRDPSHYDALDRFIMQPVGLLQSTFINRVAEGAADLWMDYVYLVQVRRENDRLHSENLRLRADAARYRAEHDENRRLRRLLQLRVDTPGEVFAAEVIAKDTSPFFRVTRLAISTPDRTRIHAGMPAGMSKAGTLGSSLATKSSPYGTSGMLTSGRVIAGRSVASARFHCASMIFVLAWRFAALPSEELCGHVGCRTF